jgi:histone deacetylase 11
MYAVIDALEFMALIGAMIYAIVSSQWYIGVPCAIFWCVYPVMNEMIYNCFARIFGSHQRFQPTFRSRFVYSENYNLSFCGLENLHPFDSQKYRHVIEKLLEYGIVT